jgi:hypothetical protein
MGFRLRWWEVAIGVGPMLLALLFLAGGLFVPGLVLLLLLLLTAALRARIIEREVAGAHAQAKGLLLITRSLALLALYSVVLGFLLVAQRQEWNDETPGTVAVYALAGLAVFLIRDVWRYGEQAMDHFIGSDAERRVAEELEPLRAEGWTIVHNLLRDGRANVDHFVVGPNGAFAIETKSGRYRAADRGQAISNAIWAKEHFGERFVTAVLCVGRDAPEAPRRELHGRSEVWVMAPSDLRNWIRAYQRAHDRRRERPVR